MGVTLYHVGPSSDAASPHIVNEATKVKHKTCQQSFVPMQSIPFCQMEKYIEELMMEEEVREVFDRGPPASRINIVLGLQVRRNELAFYEQFHYGIFYRQIDYA